MKRKLALVMATAVVAGTVPAIPAHAATDNRVTTVITARSDDEFGTETVPDRKTERTDWTTLKVKNDKGDITTTSTFRLVLADGAKWAKKDAGALEGTSYEVEQNVAKVYQGDSTSTLSVAPHNLNVKVISENILEVTVDRLDVNDTIHIPMIVKFDGAVTGEQKVTVDPRNAAISAGTYTYATVGAGSSIIKVDTKATITRGEKRAASTVIIDEITPSSWSNSSKEEFKLRLPSEFSWRDVTVTRGVVEVPTADITKDDRDLTIKVQGTAALESLVIKSEIDATRDAKYGDISVSVLKGDVSPTSFIIGEYKDYGVDVKADKVIDVLSGRNDDVYKVKLILEENAEGALLDGRYMTFEMDKNVAAITNKESIKITKKVTGTGDYLEVQPADGITGAGQTGATIERTKDKSGNTGKDIQVSDFEVIVNNDTKNTKDKYEIEVPVVVAANATGDIKMKIKGAGLDEKEVVIAKAKKPVTVEVNKGEGGKLADLRVGVQEQAAPDIIITEAQADAIKKGVAYTIEGPDNYKIVWDDAKVEVIEGDLKLDYGRNLTETDTSLLRLVAKSGSTKPSKIKITGVKVTLDRAVPEGKFKVDFKIADVKQDHKYLTNTVESVEYFNVVTPASVDKKVTSKFTIDSNEYTVIVDGKEEKRNLDAAAYIKDGRTMLPIRAIAETLGADVQWNANTRTATITKADRVISMNLDTNVMIANGTPITMDTKPEIKNGRAFLPVAYAAQALGLQYGKDLLWNESDRTVTIYPNN